MTQTAIAFTGKELRDQGMKRALDHAEAKHDNWGSLAYSFLIKYIRSHKRFMTEQVREASKGIVPEPPSKRAWGSVVARASREGLILRIGYGKVQNPKAHRTPATVWERRGL